MSRYIDADNIEFHYIPFSVYPNVFVKREDIEKIPTADVAPVRHAHWIIKQHEWDFGDPPNDYIDYTCSNCKIRLDNDTLFCPYCGAKMDEERAAKRIEIAVQMVNGNLGSLIGARGCGKSPVTGPTSFNIDDPDCQEEKKLPKYKIMVWKNFKTNKWQCLIREGETFDWLLAPEFETKEEAKNLASSIVQQWGFEFEDVEL